MWYYMRDTEQVGPVSPEELLRLMATGTLAADVYVWAEGMSEWRPASEIVELGGHLPPVSSAEELMPASVVRPKPVTVFGILNIIFGILGLLCTPLALAVMFLPTQPEGLALGPAMKAYGIVGHLVGFAASILLLAAGIGLLHLKRRARQASFFLRLVCPGLGPGGPGRQCDCVFLDAAKGQPGNNAGRRRRPGRGDVRRPRGTGVPDFSDRLHETAPCRRGLSAITQSQRERNVS